MTNTKQAIKFLVIALLLIAPSISFAQYSYSYGNLSGSCSTNISNPNINNSVNWSAYAVGGSGVYTYSWSDIEGFSSMGQYVSKYYTTPGLKTMTLTVISGSQTITRYCSVYVSGTVLNNTVYNPSYTYTPPVYQNPTYPVQNQVLGYNSSNPKLAAVYLSDVPYTGFKDVMVSILFMWAVLTWSIFLAHKFTRETIV